MIETGETLKRSREVAGISLEEVSTDLSIPVLYLEQIEDGSIGSFDNIYELKQMILNYAKYLGLNTEEVTKKFNEYMFDYTSKIPMNEIEKAVRKQQKKLELEEKIASPYTRVYPKEKTLPYILAAIGILVLVILAVLWSVKQITIDNRSTEVISFFK